MFHNHDGLCATAQPLLALPEATRRAADAMSDEIVAAVRIRDGERLAFEEALAIGLLVHAEDRPSHFADCLELCLPVLAARVGSDLVAAVRRDGRVSFERVEGDPLDPDAAFAARMAREPGFEPAMMN